MLTLIPIFATPSLSFAQNSNNTTLSSYFTNLPESGKISFSKIYSETSSGEELSISYGKNWLTSAGGAWNFESERPQNYTFINDGLYFSAIDLVYTLGPDGVAPFLRAENISHDYKGTLYLSYMHAQKNQILKAIYNNYLSMLKYSPRYLPQNYLLDRNFNNTIIKLSKKLDIQKFGFKYQDLKISISLNKKKYNYLLEYNGNANNQMEARFLIEKVSDLPPPIIKKYIAL